MRNRINLEGLWDFKLDPMNKGESEGWQINGFERDMEIKVPHVWQNENSKLVDYTGTAWYCKNFSYGDIDCTKVIYVHFSAVDYYSRIWVNGRFVGEHEGGFTPFEFNITTYLNKGMNRITLRVFDPSDNSEIPIGKQGSWYTRVSGIWQGAYIEERSSLYVNNVFIKPNIINNEVDINVRFIGKINGNQSVKYYLCDSEFDNKVYVNGSFEIKELETNLNIKIYNPILWEPSNPYLYKFKVEIYDDMKIDSFCESFGMRNVSFYNNMITLNGKPVYIRGALDQGFYPETIYYAPNDEYIINEIKQAKAMGLNMLRKHIKAEIPRYLYWADRLGILIWAEVPNYVKWTKVSRKRFENELFSIIERDFNHPSIIMWSLYNEEWGLEWCLANDKEKQVYLEYLYNNVKKYDPTRLICDNSGWHHIKTDINDYHRYFTSPEQIASWKDDIAENITRNPKGNFVDGYIENGEPIILSEFGIWGLPSTNNIREYYKGIPSWFDVKGDDTHKEDYKSPKKAEENFKKFNLCKIFRNFDELSKISRKRMYRGIKSLIEEMRKNPMIAGYILTEFTDIEWETNGLLDYFRNPKFNNSQMNYFNNDLAIILDMNKHNFWENEEATWDLVISNNGALSINGKIIWELEGTSLWGEINANAFENFTRIKKAIAIKMPESNISQKYYLRLKLISDNKVMAENQEELTISPRININNLSVYPHKMSEVFIHSLKAAGYNISNGFDNNSTVVTSHLDGCIINYANNGGKVIFLAEDGDDLEDKGQFTFRKLPEGENWARTSSMNFVDTNYFKGIPLEKEMGWEVAELIPGYVIPFSNYNKPGGAPGQVVYFNGNNYNEAFQQIISGYFQGWLGQFSGTIVNERCGNGNIFIVTWKLICNYGTHPIATQILDKLIENAL